MLDCVTGKPEEAERVVTQLPPAAIPIWRLKRQRPGNTSARGQRGARESVLFARSIET